MKVCLLIPVYNQPARIGHLVEKLRALRIPCLIVDDGSDEETRKVLDQLNAANEWVHLERRARNGGRGQAMKTAYRFAHRLGFTHALQLDADGQHSPCDVPALLEEACRRPEAMILADPVFDSSAPRARLYGRWVSRVWVWVETLSLDIHDPLCGLRCLPLEPALRVIDRDGCGDKMDFDTELVVRLFWDGVSVVNVKAGVRYFEDGISHFDPILDNLRISWLHARLFFGMLPRVPRLLARRARGRS